LLFLVSDNKKVKTVAKNLIPSIDTLKEFLRFVPVNAVQNWLKIHGKPYTTQSQGQFYKKLNKWIAQERISSDDIDNAVYDIEENGGKKVFLRVLSGNFPKSKSQFDAFLNSQNIPNIARVRRSVRTSKNPILNHILWIDGENSIIIKFSEIQEDVNFNNETFEVETLEKPIFVVINIDTKTGFTEFRFDNPAKRHVHKDVDGNSNSKVYENYYFNKIQSLFSGVTIEYYGLNEISEKIVTEGFSYFRISREQTTTTGNGKQTYSVGSGDVRELPARIGAAREDGENWIFDDLTGYWVAQASNGELSYDLFMRLSKDESSLRFQRDCLGVELRYAIRKIRNIKEGL
jgi:hypothetical protein